MGELQNLCDSMKASVHDEVNNAGIFWLDISSCKDLGITLRNWLQSFEVNHPRIYVDIKKHFAENGFLLKDAINTGISPQYEKTKN